MIFYISQRYTRTFSASHWTRGTVSQEGYRQALVVMQQLKERNDSLREKNAELAEEMFVPDTWQICHEKAKTIQNICCENRGALQEGCS